MLSANKRKAKRGSALGTHTDALMAVAITTRIKNDTVRYFWLKLGESLAGTNEEKVAQVPEGSSSLIGRVEDRR